MVAGAAVTVVDVTGAAGAISVTVVEVAGAAGETSTTLVDVAGAPGETSVTVVDVEGATGVALLTVVDCPGADSVTSVVCVTCALAERVITAASANKVDGYFVIGFSGSSQDRRWWFPCVWPLAKNITDGGGRVPALKMRKSTPMRRASSNRCSHRPRLRKQPGSIRGDGRGGLREGPSRIFSAHESRIR